MRNLLTRLALAALLSAVSAAVFVPAVAGWVAGNTCTTTSGVCVSGDDGLGVPRAVTCCTDSSYVGDLYFNTNFAINNSASSVQNKFTSVDIIFFDGTSSSGSAYCQDSNSWNSNLGFAGFWPDDSFSSHAVQANDTPCPG